MLHNGQSGGEKQGLHDVLVHARGRAQYAGADVWDVRQFKQSLNSSVLAESPVQDGEDDVHVNSTVGYATREPSLGLKRR